jgi:hypothetical protein
LVHFDLFQSTAIFHSCSVHQQHIRWIFHVRAAVACIFIIFAALLSQMHTFIPSGTAPIRCFSSLSWRSCFLSPRRVSAR